MLSWFVNIMLPGKGLVTRSFTQFVFSSFFPIVLYGFCVYGTANVCLPKQAFPVYHSVTVSRGFCDGNDCFFCSLSFPLPFRKPYQPSVSFLLPTIACGVSLSSRTVLSCSFALLCRPDSGDAEHSCMY